jgi:Rieske Fe-S protein
MSNTNTDRRKFLTNAATIAAGVAVVSTTGGLLSSCENYVSENLVTFGQSAYVDITLFEPTPPRPPKPSIKRVGQSFQFKFGKFNYGVPVIIYMSSSSPIAYACYSSMCTHMNCFGKDVKGPLSKPSTTPGFEDFSRVICSCHGSKYDPFNNGAVINGPAEKPLLSYPISYYLDQQTGHEMLEIKF